MTAQVGTLQAVQGGRGGHLPRRDQQRPQTAAGTGSETLPLGSPCSEAATFPPLLAISPAITPAILNKKLVHLLP